MAAKVSTKRKTTTRKKSKKAFSRWPSWSRVVILTVALGGFAYLGSTFLNISHAAALNTFMATDDTYIASNAPNHVYGSDTKLVTCGSGTPVCSVDSTDEKRTYLKFNVSGLGGTPTSATLRFYVTTNSVPSMIIKKMTSTDWTEGTLTWANGNGLPTDPATYTSVSGSTAGWYQADVTGAITGDGVYAFEVVNPTSTTTRLASKEGSATETAQLVINVDSTTTTSPTPAPTTDPVVAAAGDISTRTKTGGNKKTSDLVVSLNPDRVLTMGDDEYPDGSLADFNTYFNATWGRFKDKIYPTPANHEYYTDTGATGYYTYFGARANPQDPSCTSHCQGYYSFDYGNWHLIALNTNHNGCEYVACDANSAQVAWLKADLAANTQPCILAYWGNPRWSSGTKHGSDPTVGPIWDALYAAHADLVLNGHEHLYERFAKQNPSGVAAADGIRQITVGTGGNGGLYSFGTPIANSQVRNDSTLGVILLTLHSNSYDWKFVPVSGGTFTDSGSETCNN